MNTACYLIIVVLMLALLVCIYSYILFSIIITPRRQKKVFKRNTTSDSQSIPQEFVNLFHSISITAKDGIILNAYQYKKQVITHNWIICVHGYGGAPGNMAKYAQHFSKRNMNILLPELRGHDRSKSKYSGLSYLDGFDLNLWIKNILKQDEEARIILFGLSMGGSSVATACGLENIKNVKCIITDSAPSSMYRQIKQVYGWISKFPEFPVFLVIQFIIAVKAHFCLKDASVLNYIQQIDKPWLIIHGETDGFVSPKMAKELFRAAICPKEIYLVPKAEHTKALEVQPEQYWKTVDNFINKYLEG